MDTEMLGNVKPEWVIAWAAVGQLLAALILVGVTAWYAQRTSTLVRHTETEGLQRARGDRQALQSEATRLLIHLMRFPEEVGNQTRMRVIDSEPAWKERQEERLEELARAYRDPTIIELAAIATGALATVRGMIEKHQQVGIELRRARGVQFQSDRYTEGRAAAQGSLTKLISEVLGAATRQ